MFPVTTLGGWGTKKNRRYFERVGRGLWNVRAALNNAAVLAVSRRAFTVTRRTDLVPFLRWSFVVIFPVVEAEDFPSTAPPSKPTLNCSKQEGGDRCFLTCQSQVHISSGELFGLCNTWNTHLGSTCVLSFTTYCVDLFVGHEWKMWLLLNQNKPLPHTGLLIYTRDALEVLMRA